MYFKVFRLGFTLLLLIGWVLGSNYVASAATQQAGSLDTTFGEAGLLTTGFGIEHDEARAVAIQVDGKIIVAGVVTTNGYGDFAMARYNTDGSLDSSFGTGGKVITDFGKHDIVRAIAIQNDGKIILAGYSALGLESAFAIARYSNDGTLDAGFGSDGKLITDFGSGYDYAQAVAVQLDGKIIMVGNKYIGINDDDIALVRYNPDGSLDADFGTDGIATTAIGTGSEFGASLAIQPDGKIVVGGISYSSSGNFLDLALVRYHINGSLDTSFDTDGIVSTDFNNTFNRGGYVALQEDGKIVISGYDDNDNALLARYNDNGSLDMSFGTDGKVISYIGTSFQLRGLTLQPGGGIILVGYAELDNDFALILYTNDGSLDAKFGVNGKVSTDFGSNQDDLANAVALQSDGKIVVAGYRYISGSNYDWALARYIGSAIPHSISGNAGVGGATLIYTDGSLKTEVADASGNYSIAIPSGWSGTVTPSHTGYGFIPTSRTYSNVTKNLSEENYSAIMLPGAFIKTSPANSMSDQTLTPTLSWESSSDATSYEYCYSSAPGPCTQWHSVGANTSVTLSGLSPNYTYYWQVRAVNAGGTSEANGGWWSFTTINASACAWPAYTEPTSATFGDVPMDVGHWSWVERLANATITAGCGAGNYCPFSEVVRAQMAIFLLRGKHCGSSYVPPAVGASTGFNDVPTDASYAPWVKQLAAEGVTAGCGGGNFCPQTVVNRAQMVIFLLRARHGATYSPPAVGATTGFGDVPLDASYAAWVKQLATEGITAGCGNGNFCPLQNVNRAQMATFLVRAFGLP